MGFVLPVDSAVRPMRSVRPPQVLAARARSLHDEGATPHRVAGFLGGCSGSFCNRSVRSDAAASPLLPAQTGFLIVGVTGCTGGSRTASCDRFQPQTAILAVSGGPRLRLGWSPAQGPPTGRSSGCSPVEGRAGVSPDSGPLSSSHSRRGQEANPRRWLGCGGRGSCPPPLSVHSATVGHTACFVSIL